jgi:hypothetical protein
MPFEMIDMYLVFLFFFIFGGDCAREEERVDVGWV